MKPKSKKAFTLIELLVVISVMALLMGILMPALSKAREQGSRVYCLSNLRQMAMAASTYAQNCDDYCPIAHYSGKTSTEIWGYNWDFTTIKNTSTGKMDVAVGTMWQGQAIEKIHQCPSFKGGSITSSNPFSGYNYNTSYIGHGEDERVSSSYFGEVRTARIKLFAGVFINKKIVMPVKINKVRHPSRCALFGDGGFNDDTNKFMRAPWRWEGDTDNNLKAAGAQAYRHAGMTNVAWCDGHAGSQKELYTETLANEKIKLERYNASAKNKVGFLSPDNSLYDLE
jgi:prepilin-type N-terminal cleavage/methylation domain-containing protein/prepilin-type processing-associated H-X9-DG protein